MSDKKPVKEEPEGVGLGKCVCGRGEAQEPHTCPYNIDVHDDETLCNCCESCEDACSMEV